MLAKTWWAHFCVKVYFTLAFAENINHFDSQFLETVERRFLYIYSIYIVIYMRPCRRSYILLIRIFRTSEMLDEWSPTSKLSDIKLSHIPDSQYIFLFVCEPTCLPYLFLISSNLFPCFPVTEFCILDNMST